MKTLGLKSTLIAKPETAKEVASFIKNAVELAKKENKTITWYSFQVNETTFGIFDTFETEEGREAHLNGEIAQALMANAERLLAEPPVIEKINILSSK
jgi:quinol monooxygenase YgiN